MDETLSLVLFSGTDDKLNAAAVLCAGAAAMGRKVNVFLQYWALDAFRAGRYQPQSLDQALDIRIVQGDALDELTVHL